MENTSQFLTGSLGGNVEISRNNHSRLGQNLGSVSRKIEHFISGYISKSSARGLAIGLSGGLDSSVVLKLCVDSIGSDKVLGLILPSSHTPQQDIKDAIDLAEGLKIKYQIIDLNPIIERYAQVLPEDKRAMGNLTARIRMNILYYHAAINDYLVVGTSDKSERETGFFTKYGDGGADILPIADLYKTEVRALAHFLKIPESIMEKKSSPRLWENHLAEEEIGMSYDILDQILRALIDKRKKPAEIAGRPKHSPAAVKKVKEMVDKGSHKRDPPPIAKVN